mmetsp:Transcript_33625/g.46017  ORF Transcript_33625/g.46017 Transcript_33625/m.46017 type:complete len:202 (+) Transcript_33625:215-820(+)
MVQHDGNLNTKNTLTQKNMSDSLVNIVSGGVSSFDHVSINKLHALSTLSTDLSADDDFTTLGAAVHDESQNTITGTTDCQSHQKLVAERLSLCHSAEGTVLNTLSEKLNGSLRETKAFLDNTGQFTNADGFVTQDILCTSGSDHDFSPGGGHTNLDTGVVILSELTSQEFVQLGIKDTVSNELSFLRHRRNRLVIRLGFHD